MPEQKKDEQTPPQENGQSNQTPPQENGQSSQNNPQATEDNIKGLQQVISQKDREISDLKKQISSQNDSQKLEQMAEEIKFLKSEIEKDILAKKRETLAQTYPDISPDLLLYVPDDKLAEIVENQRETAKTNFGDSAYFQAPQYSSVKDVEVEIDKINTDANLTGEEKAVKVLSLERIKRVFNN